MNGQQAPAKLLGRREREAVRLVAERGYVRSRELAEAVGISLSSASHVLDRLVRRGFLVREPVYLVTRRSRLGYALTGAAQDLINS